MRRQLLLDGAQPLLAHYYPGLLPWTYHLLTLDELNGFIKAIPKPRG